MHIVGPYLTTTNISNKVKATKSQKQTIASQKHEDWLRSMGVHPDQIEMKRMKSKDNGINLPNLKVQNSSKLSNNLSVKGGFRNSIMDNLQNESPEIQDAIISKSKQIAPAYSKGAYQYITPGTDLTDIGKKK